MINGLIFNLRKLIKKPLKVAIIAKNYFSKTGANGTAVHSYRISQGLAKFGCEVHVFTKGEKNIRRHKYFDKGIVVVHEIAIKSPIQKMDSLSEHRFHHALFEMAVLPKLMEEHNVSNFDILHSQGTGGGSSALIAKYFSGIPWIHTFHGLEKKRVKMLSEEEGRFLDVSKWFESTIEFADAHITVSEDLRNEVLNEWGDKISKNNVIAIPNGVNREIFHVDPEIRKEKKIVFVGRFSVEKGIRMLPKIIAGVFEENDDVSFEIVAPISNVPDGLIKTEQELNELSEKYPSRIIWHKKAVSRDEIAKIYNQSMLIVQPSKYESFGLTVLEAMACGCVPVSSNRGGLPEVVGNAGKVVNLKLSLFVRGIVSLLEDYRLRERYSKRGVERSKMFEWEDVALRTLNLYKKIIQENKSEISEKEAPRVSVILPAYNAEKFVEEAIKSVLDQSYQNFELIVINDASTDNTKKIINRLAVNNKKIVVINNKNNLGKAASVNRAFEIAKGEYLAFLDADDFFTPDRLKKQVSYLDRNKKIDLAYGDFQKLFPDGKVENRKAITFSDVSEPLKKLEEVVGSKKKFGLSAQILHDKDYIPACSVMFRRKIIDNGITMDSEQRCEDYDFWFQIIGAGYLIKRMPHIITYIYRFHPDQKTKDIDLTYISDQDVIKKAKAGMYFK